MVRQIKKQIVILFGSVLLAVLAFGAVKTLVIAPKTVADTAELLEMFYTARASLPPLPPPVDYKTVAVQLSEDRFDFLATPDWAFSHSEGTLYLSEKSKLSLSLPMQLVAYEDLASGKVVLTGTAVGSKNIQTLAIVDAPEFAEQKSGQTVESWLMKEIGPRRIIWTALLKSEEEAWADLLSVEEQTLAAPMMMTMSVPEPIADFRVIQDGTNLSVNLPGGFADAEIILYSCTNLIEGIWTPLSTNTAVSNGVMSLGTADIPDLIYETTVSTQWENCPNHDPMDPNAVCTNQALVTVTNQVSIGGGLMYYHASASSTNDTDGDGLLNLEEYSLGTDFDSADTDGDGMPDPYEIEQGFDPTLYADGGYDPDSDNLVNSNEYLNGTDPFDSDTDDDEMPDGWEVSAGLNPLIANAAVDLDFDGLTNLQEYQEGLDPNNPDSDGDSVLDGNDLNIALRDPNSSDVTPPVITLTAPSQTFVIIP